jgi:hypothetical protein
LDLEIIYILNKYQGSKMKKLLVILLIISILGLTSCTLMMPEPAPEPTAPQTDIDEIESSMDEIDDLEQELDLSELDELEQDLDSLDW